MASTEVDNILPLSSISIVAENAVENIDTAGIVFDTAIIKSVYTFYTTHFRQFAKQILKFVHTEISMFVILYAVRKQ